MVTFYFVKLLVLKLVTILCDARTIYVVLNNFEIFRRQLRAHVYMCFEYYSSDAEITVRPKRISKLTYDLHFNLLRREMS